MRPSLVVTDLDGTLWSHDLVISESTFQALRTLDAEGIPVLAATARDLRITKPIYEANELALPSVYLNGAIGQYVSGDVFHIAGMSTQTSAQVIDAFASAGISPQVYVAERPMNGFVTATPSACKSFLEFVESSLVEVESLHEVTETHKALQIACMGIDSVQATQAQRLLEAIPEVLSYHMPEHHYLGGGESTVIVQSATAGKWAGVLAYCDSESLDPGKVLAVGDGINDIDVLTNAAVACAMPASISEVIAIADVVLPPERGWAAVLDLI